MKIPTSKIFRKKNFDLGDYTYQEAREKAELVAIGDNQVFHKIREYYKDNSTPLEIYDKVQKLYAERDMFKKIKETKENSKELRQKLVDKQDEIDNILYVRDIINVKVTNKNHYKDIALKHFKVNGITYKRLCCGSGQMRRNTVTFVNEELYDYLMESLMCGLNGKIQKITLAKLSAYFALSFSSVLWVREPRVCVIKDFFTTIPQQKIDFIVKHEDGTKTVEERIMDIELNSADGQGLISPQCAKWFSEDMGLDYDVCQFVIRSPFLKGCLLSFDFATYSKQVCGIDTITDMYGVSYPIDEIDVLVTESMFKMHKHYKSWQEYTKFHKMYNLKWGVARYNKKHDPEYSLLNYQYIQNCNLSDNDIDELIKPTISWINNICSGDDLYSLLYALGVKNGDEDFDDILEQCGDLFTKAVLKNKDMLKDGYVQKKLYDSIKESIRQAKIGRVWAKGGYQFMLSDPIPLLRNALGLDSTGLIPANQIYSNYWNNIKPKELGLYRSPMVDRHESNIVTLFNTQEARHWYQYLYSGIVYSIYDTSTIRHSDSDFDGDIVFSTDNQRLIKGAYRYNNPITYDKDKAPEKDFTYENIVMCDMDGFDTLVGQITNNSTSITAMLPNFPIDRYPNEHNELITRLKLLREIIGAEIDKIKLGVSPEFPKEWVEREHIHDEDSDIEKARKYKRNSLVINKKAYFMIYIYDTLYRSYQNHMKQFDFDCKNKFGISYLDLKYSKNKTKPQKKFLKRNTYLSPVLDTSCIMNKLCHKIEHVEKNIMYSKNFNQSYLYNFNQQQYEIDDDVKYQLLILYKKYQAQKKFVHIKQIIDEVVVNKDEYKEYMSSMTKELARSIRKECYSLISNAERLFEYLLAIADDFKSENKQFSYNFIWDILDKDILNVIPQGNSYVCVQSDEGREYLGNRYELKEVSPIDNLG